MRKQATPSILQSASNSLMGVLNGPFTYSSDPLWDVIVAVLDEIVGDGGEPVFGDHHDVGVPRVVELQLPGGSRHDNVEGCVRGRVGRQFSDPSKHRTKDTCLRFRDVLFAEDQFYSNQD